MLSRILLLLVLLLPGRLFAQAPLRLGDEAFHVGEHFRHATLSPDGKTIAVTGQFGRFYRIDIATGRVARNWSGSKADLLGIGFDSAGRVMTYDWDRWIRTFDPATGEKVREVLVDPGDLSGDVEGIFHAGGRYLQRRGFRAWDPVEAIFDTRSGLDVPVSQSARFTDYALSPDGRLLMLQLSSSERLRSRLRLDHDLLKRGSRFRPPLLVDLDTMQEREGPPLPLQDSHAWAFTAAGHLLMVHDSHSILHADLITGEMATLKLDGLADLPRIIYFRLSPDQRRIAAVFHPNHPQRVIEWDIVTGRRLLDWPLPEMGAFEVAYTPEGRLLAWNKDGVSLRVHRPPDGRPERTPGHTTDLNDLRFTADGRTLESLDVHGRILRWDTTTGQIVGEELLPIRREIPGVYPDDIELRGFDPGGERVLFQFDPPEWYHRATGKFEPLPPQPPQPQRGPYFMTRDRRRALYTDERGPWLLHELETGRGRLLPPANELWAIPREGKVELLAPVGCPRLALLAADDDKSDGPLSIAVLDAASLQIVSRFTTTSRLGWIPLHLSPDGATLAVPDVRGLTLFDTGTGRVRSRLAPPTEGNLWPLAFAPDGRTILVLHRSSTPELLLIEVATGSPRRRWTWPALANPPTVPRFSPDGRFIAYPRWDSTILLLATDAPAQTLDPATIWRDLSSRDAAVANVAVQALAARPGARKEIAGRRLLLERTADEVPEVLDLLPALDADDPAQRTAAQRKLRAVPVATLQALLDSLLGGSAEVRRALHDAIDMTALLPEPTPAELRRLRVTEVLERIARRD
jgi:WD40 repeat protein